MKKEDLVIGNEYYFDLKKQDKGIFKGTGRSIGIFFEPTENKNYKVQECNTMGFIGCVGFLSGKHITPVEP